MWWNSIPEIKTELYPVESSIGEMGLAVVQGKLNNLIFSL
jgi:hypothetical protein